MSAPAVIHIERANPDVESCVHHMLCGESCIVLGEWITPPNFNFYSYTHGHKATCTACQTERLRLTNTAAMAEA